MSNWLPILNSLTSMDFPGHSMATLFENASQTASASLVSVVWQSAVFAGALAIILKLAPRTTASLRFALWSVAMLVLVFLPFAGFLPRLWSAPAHAATSAPATSGMAFLQMDERWSLVIGILWLSASLYRAFTLLKHAFRLRKLWTSAAPVEDAAGYTPYSLRKPVQIFTTTRLDRPGVIGFRSPRILIPEWLYAQLSPAELKQIVLHECEHLRRGDDWTNLFQKLCLVLFSLNPVLIWVERQLCIEREMACDEGVIEATHAPRAYATCLARLAERGLQHRSEALALGAWQRRPELARRIHSILRSKPSFRPQSSRALLAAVAGCLLVGSIELSRAPQLVAFVPPSANQHEVVSAVASTNFPGKPSTFGSQQPARFVTAGSRQPIQPHLTELRAVMPAQSESPIGDAAPQIHAALRPRTPSHSPREINASARISTTHPVSDPEQTASNQPQEQWIVLTTWLEQSLPVGSSDSWPDDQRPSATSQTIVTQLVFHVVARPSADPTPNAATQPSSRHADLISLPPRAGWLFFQL